MDGGILSCGIVRVEFVETVGTVEYQSMRVSESKWEVNDKN